MKTNSNKYKIAFVSDTLIVGGVEKALIELLCKFDYDKYDVSLWLKNSDGEWVSKVDEHVDIKIWGISDTRSLLKNQIKYFKFFSFLKGCYNRLLCRKNAEYYDLNELYSVKALPKIKEKYDCVIAYKAISPETVANVIYRFNADKKVLWVHGRNALVPKNNKCFDNIYKKFDKIYCVSKDTMQSFSSDFPKSSIKTDLFYNLVNSDEIIEKAEEHIKELDYCTDFTSLVTVGRLAPVKGQMLIPKTARMLLDSGYKIKWYLIGDGPLREELEKEIEKYNVKENVILLGTKDNPYPYMKACDIYVQTSYSEGYCTTTCEAKILHKPIVTTNAPGMSEQFKNGENGIIVSDSTSESLYDGIKTLLEQPELSELFTENLKKEKYDASKEMQKLYDFIES